MCVGTDMRMKGNNRSVEKGGERGGGGWGTRHWSNAPCPGFPYFQDWSAPPDPSALLSIVCRARAAWGSPASEITYPRERKAYFTSLLREYFATFSGTAIPDASRKSAIGAPALTGSGSTPAQTGSA